MATQSSHKGPSGVACSFERNLSLLQNLEVFREPLSGLKKEIGTVNHLIKLGGQKVMEHQSLKLSFEKE
jgi:hypothetical protein